MGFPRPLNLCLTTFSMETSFPSRVPTTTEPVTVDGEGAVLDPASARGAGSVARQRASQLLLIPVGTDAADETLKVRVIGWRRISTLWVPVTLAEFTCTLGASVGVADEDVTNDHFFADTVSAVDTGNDNWTVSAVSPADDTIAHVIVNTADFEKLEVTFHRNSSTASVNALYAFIE